MTRKARNLGVVLCLLCAAMLAACPGDRMSQSTTEAVDDSLIANKVTLALYSDKQVHGRGIKVESAQGVVELTGVVASAAEAQRAVQIAQQVKGVKAVHNRLRVQRGTPGARPLVPPPAPGGHGSKQAGQGMAGHLRPEVLAGAQGFTTLVLSHSERGPSQCEPPRGRRCRRC